MEGKVQPGSAVLKGLKVLMERLVKLDRQVKAVLENVVKGDVGSGGPPGPVGSKGNVGDRGEKGEKGNAGAAGVGSVVNEEKRAYKAILQMF